jgi:para-nitrobenzyl esterase
MQSAPELKKPNHGLPSAEGLGALFEKSLHAADLKAFRAMDARTITDAPTARGGPTVDGWVVPDQMVNLFDRKEAAVVPVLMGFNRNEIFPVLERFLPPTLPVSSREYESEVQERYGDLAPEFLHLYPGKDIQGSMGTAVRDAVFAWSAERIARDEAKAGQPSYFYFFDHGYPAEELRRLHAFHGDELSFVFGQVAKDADLPANWPVPVGPKDQAISDAMMAYWTSFARTGAPKAPGQPDWPTFMPAGSYMDFGDAPKVKTDLIPGMFELNEEVLRRELRAGDQPWTGNVGVAAPVLLPKQ